MSRILVVDDEEQAQTLVGEVLRAEGHEVTEASNGREAFDLLRETHVQAIVIDLRMPFGLRLIKALRATGDTVPIIAVSGANGDQLMLAQDYGANAGLLKPLDHDELLDVLDRPLSDTRDSWTDAWISSEFGSMGDR